MIKYLAGGGLGDASLTYARLYTNPYIKNDEDCHLTYQVCKGTDEVLKEQIRYLFDSQNVNHDIVVVPSWNNALDPKNFDYILEGGWSGKGWQNESNCWEINPFPAFRYKYIPNVKNVLVISSGRNLNRMFEYDSVINFLKKYPETILAGMSTDKRIITLQGKNNLVNKTSFDVFVNLLCSSTNVIGQSGFCVYFGGMAGKKVFYVSEGLPSIVNIHPKWNTVQINDLQEVIL